MQKRDEDLDIIRALGMLWISFVHCIYWTNVFTDPMSMKIVSWLLIEMPVMFFVMGASNRDSDTSVYGKFVLRRLKRVYIPYIFYAFVCWIFTLEAYGLSGASRLINLLIMSSFEIGVPEFASSMLWFLPCYCFLIAVYPLLKKYNKCIKENIFGYIVFYILIYAGIIYNTGKDSFWNYVFVYIFWVYTGVFYNYIIKNNSMYKRLICVGISVACFISVYFIRSTMSLGLDMQLNKFPPNIMFQQYTLAVLSLLAAFIDYILKAVKYLKNKFVSMNWFFETYSKYSYSIFIMQAFSLFVVKSLINFFAFNWALNINAALSLLIYAVCMIPIAGFMGKLYYNNIESKLIKLFS
jgi:hypothetical protein